MKPKKPQRAKAKPATSPTVPPHQGASPTTTNTSVEVIAATPGGSTTPQIGQQQSTEPPHPITESGQQPKKPPAAPPTKEQRIAKEARRLKARLKGLDKNKLETAAPLIRNAARLTVAIDDIWDDYLTADIGYIEEYDNGGGQRGKKPSEARKAINEMTKHHITIMRILIELAPPAPLKRDTLDDIIEM